MPQISSKVVQSSLDGQGTEPSLNSLLIVYATGLVLESPGLVQVVPEVDIKRELQVQEIYWVTGLRNKGQGGGSALRRRKRRTGGVLSCIAFQRKIRTWTVQ